MAGAAEGDEMKTVLEQALEALVNARRVRFGVGGTKSCDELELPAIASLKEAIKQQGEPVAWLYEAEGFADAWSKTRMPLEILFGGPTETALYTSAPTIPDEAIRQAKREALFEAAEHFYNSSWIEMDDKKRISKDSLVKELRRMAEEMK
jgi:hypothetical protein